jgi:ATP-dependent DNA helicase PIF1
VPTKSEINDAFDLFDLDVDVSIATLNVAYARLVAAAVGAKDYPHIERLTEMRDIVIQFLEDTEKEFREILMFIEESQESIFIMGKAGTGKSRLISQILEKQSPGMVACAFTGVAAQNINAFTIHKLFGIGASMSTGAKPVIPPKVRELIKEFKTVIIDEVSMASAPLINEVEERLRLAKGSPLPFGGTRMILVGDPFQLGPFETEEELKKFYLEKFGTLWFFDAPVFKTMHYRVVELQQVFRQNDYKMIEALDDIREGRNLPKSIAFFNKRALLPPVSNQALTITPKNETVHAINSKRMQELPGDFVQFDGVEVAIIPGATYVSGKSEADLPAERNLRLKIGARVMFTKNDDQLVSTNMTRRWANGSLGTVTTFSEDGKSLWVQLDHKDDKNEPPVVLVKQSTWQKYIYRLEEVPDPVTGGKKKNIKLELAVEYTQIPLKAAWAVTVHKSQGKTYDQVHVDFSSGGFAEGQLYVALSRARTMEGLTLQKPIGPNDAKVSPAVVDWVEKNPPVSAFELNLTSER